MIRPWTKAEIARAIHLRLQGKKWAEIAASLRRSESSLWVKLSKLSIRIRADGRDEESVRENLMRLHQELLAAAEKEAGDDAEEGGEEGSVEVMASGTKNLTDTTVEEDKEVSRTRILLEEAKVSKRKYQEILADRALEDRIVDIFRERMEPFAPVAPPPSPLQPVSRVGRRPESAVLLVSDTHIGQVVSREQTNGFGDYGPRIFCERLHYLERKVIEVLGEVAVGIDELHVFPTGRYFAWRAEPRGRARG